MIVKNIVAKRDNNSTASVFRSSKVLMNEGACGGGGAWRGGGGDDDDDAVALSWFGDDDSELLETSSTRTIVLYVYFDLVNVNQTLEQQHWCLALLSTWNNPLFIATINHILIKLYLIEQSNFRFLFIKIKFFYLNKQILFDSSDSDFSLVFPMP